MLKSICVVKYKVDNWGCVIKSVGVMTAIIFAYGNDCAAVVFVVFLEDGTVFAEWNNNVVFAVNKDYGNIVFNQGGELVDGMFAIAYKL